VGVAIIFFIHGESAIEVKIAINAATTRIITTIGWSAQFLQPLFLSYDILVFLVLLFLQQANGATQRQLRVLKELGGL
jgi:hypothetical protein